MKESHGITIGFGQWMLVGMPVAIVFTVIAWLVLITVFKPEMDHIPGGKELINDEVEKLGKWTGPQIQVGIIFLLAAFTWVAVPLLMDGLGWDFPYDDAIVGMTAGLLMFILPADRKTGVRLLRSEEHTSELQSRGHLVCRLLLIKKKHLTTCDQMIKLHCIIIMQKYKLSLNLQH